jgi:hypothetical protein
MDKLVLTRLLQPLVPFFQQIFTKSKEMTRDWPELPLPLENDHY